MIGNECVSHPLAGSNVRNTAACNGATTKATDWRKRDKYGGAGIGAFTLVLCSHATYGIRYERRAIRRMRNPDWPIPFAFLPPLADVAAGSGAASWRLLLFGECDARPIQVALPRGGSAGALAR